MKNIFKIVFAILFLPLMAQAQPAPVKKAAQSVFTLTTYNADGTIHYTSHGVFTGNSGEAIAMWHPFQGAAKAVIIDAKGRQYDVDAMLGVSENYDVCRFRVKGYTNASAALPLTTDNTPISATHAVQNGLIAKHSSSQQATNITNLRYSMSIKEE